MYFLDPAWAHKQVQSLVFCLSFSQLGKQSGTVSLLSGLNKPELPWREEEDRQGDRRGEFPPSKTWL